MEDGGKPYLIIVLIAIIVVLAIALAVVLYTFRKSIVKKVNNYKNKNNTSEEDVIEEEIISMEGMGEKSFNNLIQAVDKARKIPVARFVYSLGIANVGLSNAKLLCRHFNDDIELLMKAAEEDMTQIEGIGPVIARSVEAFFKDEVMRAEVEKLLCEVTLEKEERDESQMIFEGKTFVITGSVNHFANRNEVKALIESKGGKVAGSVSSKTHYLINNDAESASSKNKKAKELGIPILTEEDFLKLLHE